MPAPLESDSTAVVIGVVLAIVGVIAIILAAIVCVKCRQVRSGGKLRHERFDNQLIQEGHDGSLHRHNPLHGTGHSDSGEVTLSSPVAVYYNPGSTNPSYVNPTYTTTPDDNTYPSSQADSCNKSREGDSNIGDVDLNISTNTTQEANSPESPYYASLQPYADSHTYESVPSINKPEHKNDYENILNTSLSSSDEMTSPDHQDVRTEV